MAKATNASLPPDLDLDNNWQIVFSALDPAGGNAVANVTVSNIRMVVTQVTGTPEALSSGPFLYVPGPAA